MCIRRIRLGLKVCWGKLERPVQTGGRSYLLQLRDIMERERLNKWLSRGPCYRWRGTRGARGDYSEGHLEVGWGRLERWGERGGCLPRRGDFLFSFCFISFVWGFGGRSLLFSCVFSFSVGSFF